MTAISCPPNVEQPFHCPTQWELWRQLLSLLPTGRAWQTHEGFTERYPTFGQPAQVGSYEIGGDIGLGYEPNLERLTIMQRFWAGVAEPLEFLHQRACALIEEYFCSTVDELREEWWAEYGFPDPCDPWNTLCDKVRALGGATCSYLAGLAAARGWSLTCTECDPNPPSPRVGCFSTGCGKTCGCPGNTIWVTIDLAASPAYTESRDDRSARAGAARTGAAYTGPACPPGAELLQCLIERFKPAHVRAVYIYV